VPAHPVKAHFASFSAGAVTFGTSKIRFNSINYNTEPSTEWNGLSPEPGRPPAARLQL